MSGAPSFSFTIAGILIELHSPLSVAELGIEPRLGPFAGAPDHSAGRVSLRWEESKDALTPPGEMIYDPGAVWRMYRTPEAYYAAINYADHSPGASAAAVLRANPAWNEVTMTERREGPGWRSLLDLAACELILRTRILAAGGLIFHACAVDDHGRGLTFVGHSQAGKSTQARLWSQAPDVIVMGDDRIAVRRHEGGAICYGTPWGGLAGLACNHQAPLAALLLLEQAPENDIQPLPASAAAPLLLARAFLPYWEEALMRQALTNLDAVLACVPVYRLRCRPESAIIPLVRSTL
jgi:hypothetical protein